MTDNEFNLDNVIAEIREFSMQSVNLKSPRFHEIVREREQIICNALLHINKQIEYITPDDIKDYASHLLHERGLQFNTVLKQFSILGQFFQGWAMQRTRIPNPVTGWREGITIPEEVTEQEQSDPNDVPIQDMLRLFDYLTSETREDNPAASRDLLFLIVYLTSGMKRTAVLQMRWKDIEILEDGIEFNTFEKYAIAGRTTLHSIDARQIAETYRKQRSTSEKLTPTTPLWTRHDRAGKGGQLSSQGLGASLHSHARKAGIGRMSLGNLEKALHRLMNREIIERDLPEDVFRDTLINVLKRIIAGDTLFQFPLSKKD